MKKLIAVLLLAGVVGVLASWLVVRQQALEHERALAEQKAALEAEKAQMEAELRHARGQRSSATTIVQGPSTVVEVTKKLNPKEILDRLVQLSTNTNTNQNRNMRLIVHEFENLIDAGPAALPVIHDFLARNVEQDYDAAWNLIGKRSRDGRIATEFMLPPSLRLGLFEAVKLIGGEPAEKVLVATLGTTGRGIELAYLARALEEMAPGKYREAALAAAHDLLNQPVNKNAANASDKNERNYLYGVLAFYNDASFASQAQSQLVQADGNIDRSALKYLQQTLGTQLIAIAAQAYQDPRLIDPAAKEPLARVALEYVGADAQANEFYKKAINDSSLSEEIRKNLIEDLNEGGLPNQKNLAATDLPLIQSRLALIEQLAPNAMDQINAAAFKEAYKDLIGMRDSVIKKIGPGK